MKHARYLSQARLFACGSLSLAALSRPAAAEDAPAQPPTASEAPSAAPSPLPTAEAAPPEAAAPVAPAEAPAAATEPPAPDAAAAEPAPPPKKPPYSLPWQLRPVAPATVLRSDTAFAFYEPKGTGKSGSTIASMLLFSYKVTEDLAPLVRLGIVSNSPPSLSTPGAPKDGFGFLNPVLGAIYGVKLPAPWKLGLFLGLTIPIGSGGGKTPDADAAAAMAAGIRARSAMDNAMFASNYFAIFPGVDFAFVSDGFTAQVEATIFELAKTRGPDAADGSNTNLTMGLHVGYFVIPELSFGAELRHQRWLSTPAAVKADASGASRDTTTWAIGPRGHFKLGENIWFRPGVAFAMAIDKPMSDASYKIVQLDLPFSF